MTSGVTGLFPQAGNWNKLTAIIFLCEFKFLHWMSSM